MQMHLIIALTVCHDSGRAIQLKLYYAPGACSHISLLEAVCLLAPACDSAERCYLQKWLNFISRELHNHRIAIADARHRRFAP
jgi:hypothetical protein